MARFYDEDRLDRRIRGGSDYGHVVRQSDANDRLRYDIELADGTALTEVEVNQPHGFASNPMPTEFTEIVVMHPGGEASRTFISHVGGDSEKRVVPDPGSAVLYSPDTPANRITVDMDGNVSVESQNAINMKTSNFTFDGDAHFTGNITTDGDITSSGVHQASAHT